MGGATTRQPPARARDEAATKWRNTRMDPFTIDLPNADAEAEKSDAADDWRERIRRAALAGLPAAEKRQRRRDTFARRRGAR